MSDFIQITISIKKDILEQIESMAEKKGQKRTAVIRDALFDYVMNKGSYIISSTGDFNFVNST